MSQDPVFNGTDLRQRSKGRLRIKLEKELAALLIVTRPSPQQLARIRTVRRQLGGMSGSLP